MRLSRRKIALSGPYKYIIIAIACAFFCIASIAYIFFSWSKIEEKNEFFQLQQQILDNKKVEIPT